MLNSKKKQLVVVDRDVETLDLVSAFFKPKGFQVTCFTDGKSALNESLISGHSWDVFLTNYQFHDLMEIEYTQQIKRNLPNLPVVLIPHNLRSSTDSSSPARTGSEEYDNTAKSINFKKLHTSINMALNINENEVKTESQEVPTVTPPQYTLPTNTDNNIIGQSPCFLAAINIALRVAKSSASILLSGESGTGKEVFANFIHSKSSRNKGPFTAINCSSIPENLLESELFGHAKGSFTGASEKRVGLFEAAENGTLFLDEIGDLSLSLQGKLLRVLQEKKIKRVGENITRPINCRIISATHKDLSVEVKENRFREDLFFRLNVIPLTIPPLRERQEDLIPLAEFFLRKYARENSSQAKSFSKSAVKFLLNNQWRGNVRELENTIERAVVLCDGPEITLEHFVPISNEEHKISILNGGVEFDKNTFFVRHLSHLPSLDDVINKYISYAVKINGGARDKTAREIGIDRKTLYKRMQQYRN